MPKKKIELPIFFPTDEYEAALEIQISGQPQSKANSRQIVTNPHTGKPMVIKSKAALEYTKTFLKQITGDMQQGLGSIDNPLLLFVVVYYKSNIPDLAIDLIKDLLQKSGVISNDRWVKAELVFSRIDKLNPRTHITIFRLKNTGDK